jgi:hypothetical protein
MRFLLITQEEIVRGEEEMYELRKRIQPLRGRMHSLTLREDDWEFIALPEELWIQSGKVILVEHGLAIPEFQCFAVAFWLEEH